MTIPHMECSCLPNYVRGMEICSEINYSKLCMHFGHAAVDGYIDLGPFSCHLHYRFPLLLAAAYTTGIGADSKYANKLIQNLIGPLWQAVMCSSRSLV